MLSVEQWLDRYYKQMGEQRRIKNDLYPDGNRTGADRGDDVSRRKPPRTL